MNVDEISRRLHSAPAQNIRAAWVLGNGAGDIASGPHEAQLFFVYANCEGWTYGGFRTHHGAIPHFGAALERALKAFLASPPRNYNMPLIACHFGINVLDRDGSGKALSGKADEIWRVGAPTIGSGQLLRLGWEMERLRAEVERLGWSENPPANMRGQVLAAFALAVDRIFAAYCCVHRLWWLPITELERVAGDERYSGAVGAVAEFFRSEEIASKARAVLAAIALVVEAIPPAPVRPDEIPTWPALGENRA